MNLQKNNIYTLIWSFDAVFIGWFKRQQQKWYFGHLGALLMAQNMFLAYQILKYFIFPTSYLLNIWKMLTATRLGHHLIFFMMIP